MNAMVLMLSLTLPGEPPKVRPVTPNPALKAEFEANIRKMVAKKKAREDQKRAARQARQQRIEREAEHERLRELRMAPFRAHQKESELRLQLEMARVEIAGQNALNNARIADAAQLQSYCLMYWSGVPITYNPYTDTYALYGNLWW